MCITHPKRRDVLFSKLTELTDVGPNPSLNLHVYAVAVWSGECWSANYLRSNCENLVCHFQVCQFHLAHFLFNLLFLFQVFLLQVCHFPHPLQRNMSVIVRRNCFVVKFWNFSVRCHLTTKTEFGPIFCQFGLNTGVYNAKNGVTPKSSHPWGSHIFWHVLYQKASVSLSRNVFPGL